MTEPAGRSERPSPIDPAALLQHAWLNTLDYPPLVPSSDAPSADEIARFLDMLPKRTEADYRRAASAAYYALYHAITLRAAVLLDSWGSSDDRYLLTRRFRHYHLRDVVMWVAGDDAPPVRWIVEVEYLRNDPAIRKLTDDLLFLWGERLDADYNHISGFSQGRTLEALDIATDAVRTVTSPAFAGGEAGRAFLQLVADRANARP